MYVIIAPGKSYILYSQANRFTSSTWQDYSHILLSTKRNIDNETDSLQAQYYRNFQKMVESSKLKAGPESVSQSIDWSAHERKMVILNELQYLIESMGLDEIVDGNRTERLALENQLLAEGRNDIDNMSYEKFHSIDADESTNQKMDVILSKLPKDIRREGYQKPAFLDSIWQFNNSNITSLQTNLESVSIENIKKLLLQGPPQHKGPFCPICSLPTTDEELDDFGKCTICKQQELSKPDIHIVSIQDSNKEKRLYNTGDTPAATPYDTAQPVTHASPKIYAPKRAEMLRSYNAPYEQSLQHLDPDGSILDPDDSENNLNNRVTLIEKQFLQMQYRIDAFYYQLENLIKAMHDVQDMLKLQNNGVKIENSDCTAPKKTKSSPKSVAMKRSHPADTSSSISSDSDPDQAEGKKPPGKKPQTNGNKE